MFQLITEGSFPFRMSEDRDLNRRYGGLHRMGYMLFGNLCDASART
jgi:hypothetical protein